ncbi:DNA primase TraC [Grimontia celer]|uniref:DNA primase TraC n=1 Tax=Grimontia celer TaxID=1796497 RepID=A0A128ESL8_9GAMM|nr:phage/plasmid primase, P4 family [Grimontia celer]CZF77200.1 DNA primase TraC [Grimontia celer]
MTTQKFAQAMEQAGLVAPQELLADGKFHRFSSNGKPADKAGFYVLHSHINGIMAGVFGCWRSDIKQTWSSVERSTASLESKLVVKLLLGKAKKATAAVEQSRVNYVSLIVESAEPAKSCHPYAKKKGGISVKGAYWKRLIPRSEYFDNPLLQGNLENVLLVPVYDKDGKPTSLQAITEDGSKFFMGKGNTKGGMFTFWGTPETVYVAEGFATAASIHDTTGATVVCAFNANNLLVVAPIVKSKYEASNVIVAADNDATKEAQGKGNKGKDVAQKLFEAEALPYSMPSFKSVDEGTDWNDYACIHGNEAVATALLANLVEPSKPIETFEEAIECLKTDPKNTQAFDKALTNISQANALFKSGMMNQLKELTSVPLKDMKDRMGELAALEKPIDKSHGDMANDLVKDAGKTEMVGAYGSLWTYQANSGVWEEKTLSKLSADIFRKFNGQKLCKRATDYHSIAGFAYELQKEQDFFENAPFGVNTPEGFLSIQDGSVVLEEANPLHRARHRLEFTPADNGAEPKLFLTMLREAFAGCYPEEQIRQLRMAFGLSMFGMMSEQQRAVFLYGAAGSGKSVALKVLSSMLPDDAIASVSPYVFDNEYQRAALAGKRFNFVPEMEKDNPVPSAQFKSIVGGDKVGAREPHGKVFTYTPCATNWFNGNHYPKTTDHTEGFYRRWYVVHFNNTKPDSERDPGLLERIVAEELPAILRWSIDGVEDYLANGLYMSPAHFNCLTQWKGEGNSVQGWLNDHCENYIELRSNGSMKKPLRVSEGYALYRDWCIRCGVRAYKKATFIQHMEALGHTGSLYNGYRVFSRLAATMAVVLEMKAA